MIFNYAHIFMIIDVCYYVTLMILTSMKVMVCGSIGYGGVYDIQKLYKYIQNAGFEVLDHIKEKGMDYSDIKDFRDKKKLSKEIIEHDLNYVTKADVLVVIMNKPSYGTAIEMVKAKEAGKTIVLFSPRSIPTPWPIYFSDYVVSNNEEMIEILTDIKKNPR